VTVKSGATSGVVISCKGEGVDRVVPNTALLAWLEQQTGKVLAQDLFDDEEGTDPWREISELVRRVCEALEITAPLWFTGAAPFDRDPKGSAAEEKTERPTSNPSTSSGHAVQLSTSKEEVHEQTKETASQVVETDPIGMSASTRPATSTRDSALSTQDFSLKPAPKADDTADEPTIYLSAVLGLFPMANQGLLRDMQAMAGGEPLAGPVTSFIQANVNLDAPLDAGPEAPQQPVARRTRVFADERLVAQADPCQARAVRLARSSRGLVIHGPPGTGKSQTITNIIGDHLARGDRVLLVSDKRTALDVVANRLVHMGLGNLAALIHDPQRDQRDLYRAIRDQLEALAEVTTDDKADQKLGKVDAELQQLHGELTEYWDALMNQQAGDSFHELVGRWLGIAESAESQRLESLGRQIKLEALDQHAHLIGETLERAAKVRWWENEWRDAAGAELSAFVATPMEKWRAGIAKCVETATAADATLDPSIPAFAAGDLRQQGQARADLSTRLEAVLSTVSPEVRSRWAGAEPAALERARRRLSEVEPQWRVMKSAAADTELVMIARERLPTMADLASQLGALEQYLQIAGKWHAFLQFKRKGAAREVLAKYGLQLAPEPARRLRDFLAALRSRLVLQAVHYELYQVPAAVGLLADDVLDRTLGEHNAVFDLLAHARSTPILVDLSPKIAAALKDAGAAATLIAGLKSSGARAEALAKFEESMLASGLLDKGWLAKCFADGRRGQPLRERISKLAERLGDVENILRIRVNLGKLPPGIIQAIARLIEQPIDPPSSQEAMRKVALAAEITRRLQSDPRLQGIDAQRIASTFERYRKLEQKKRDLVRDAILHRWVSKQKERLLASTGSRLNAMGAELKRRLTLRGERAMRLRQVLAVGQSAEGGDPLFDVRPVWMASPETVAQLFPRAEVFAVVVFDEASQCRLEETLPVLVRGRRVVIAGDPRQLPPTRFFESAIAASDDDEEITTDQQLFEHQQGEIEDLLGAALNLSIDQCYLDVHYRSRSADLIEFSNEHFYSNRLQAIPGHPKNRPETAPLLLHATSGTYHKRENAAEADKVVELVRGLLAQKKPPSIGVACFNLQQRDLIVEKLDEAAAADESFARKLAEARTRSGAGSFEGLFVKNLENVQGDERDVMIISTTYGPDPSGRFYRRFGPLGRAGGGRRLNVLVTRARQAVHLVTSIPPEVYRALPPVPAGQVPSGGWLLFAYLKYAEDVAHAYAATDPANTPLPHELPAPEVRTRPTKTPSPLAESLAKTLATEHHLPSDVYWGNDGFCIDVALRRPASQSNGHAPGESDVTLGVLCDASRFTGAEDPVEWDVFRTAIHESQGWTLHRLWSPHFFRDPRGGLGEIVRESGGTA
jgi:hypothetical protein